MIYLDNAATTFPKPPCLLKTMNDCISSYCGNPGRSGHSMSLKTGMKVYEARKSIADFFHIADPSQIVFTLNATDALNLAIKGLVKSGDHVITTSMEHNSVLRPLYALEREGVELTVIFCDGQGKLDLQEVKKAIRPNTKLIACTHASNVTGTIMPIKEIGQIARRNSVHFLVDASQSAGCQPIDVNEVDLDLLAAPGHKGLMGPLGTGFLYARENIRLKHLREGGTGTESKNLQQPDSFPEGYEAGTVNAPGIIALGKTTEFIKGIGLERIQAHEEKLIGRLDEALRNMDGVTVYGPLQASEKTGVTLFNINTLGSEEVSDILSSRFQIASRGGFHCAPLAHQSIGTEETGAVRLSVSPYTKTIEIDKAIDSIYKITKDRDLSFI